ncbi:MAG: hypothetical protein ACLUD2_06055 [Clostridium sp.]
MSYARLSSRVGGGIDADYCIVLLLVLLIK